MYVYRDEFRALVAHCLGPSDQYLLSPVNVYIWLLKVALRRHSAHVEARNFLQERGDTSLVYMILGQTDLF